MVRVWLDCCLCVDARYSEISPRAAESLRRLNALVPEMKQFKGIDTPGDESHLIDLVDAVESLLNVMRRARASVPTDQ